MYRDNLWKLEDQLRMREFYRLFVQAGNHEFQLSNCFCRRRSRYKFSSPKSPPNSPNTELSTEDEFKGVYINYSCNKDGELVDKNTDWIYEWSSRPDQAPPKDWKFKHPLGVTKRKTYSIRTAKVGKNGLFSKEVLYTLFLTNFLSLLIGTGFGVWLTRRGLMVPRITIE
ncbi:BCL2/adenovirus E1B 19 kDa protein-interacting protein 3 isoform X3 [Neodiprion pinetum]|uniref:BCL2/adenovirus E1B 19 kDa protein-interacting protein 3 isoform X3 n=1 Tax=Neodiprion lecontei TaxID=441921 RepID=A0ABM3GHH9_NEOLC|nr:BCL2/adenovirus E1B 19 kDa protein-interacting protein 3 isoform X3 [Neodiprion pinetum]XP_046599727.1 BCL2/adenovirus E1B 19 kDa protein-interacting protein 3 isoform X3 [Neodiprion lecontei]